MKIKRYKNSYKTLTFFRHHYNIVPPYRILVDGSFCWAALQNQLNITEQIKKYLDAEVEVVTTKCVLHELETIGSSVHGAKVVCQKYHIDSCPHKQPVPARECMLRLAKKALNGTGSKYIMATQDDILKEKLRNLLGIPILFIAFKTILFDKLTEEAKQAVDPQNEELNKIKELKKEVFGETEVKKKKKKKVKGKNPLSCKKKIIKTTNVPQKTGEKTAAGKRRRKKKTAAPVVTEDMET